MVMLIIRKNIIVNSSNGYWISNLNNPNMINPVNIDSPKAYLIIFLCLMNNSRPIKNKLITKLSIECSTIIIIVAISENIINRRGSKFLDVLSVVILFHLFLIHFKKFLIADIFSDFFFSFFIHIQFKFKWNRKD